MPLPKRPRDSAQLAKLMVDMASGEVPKDTDQVIEALEQRERGDRRKGAGGSNPADLRASQT